MDTLWQDVKFACRTLVKAPAFTAVAVLSLALGIGANTTIFTILNAVLLSPLPMERPSELVAAYTTEQNTATFLGGTLPVSNLNFRDYRDRNVVFTDMAGYTFGSPVSMVTDGEPQQTFAELVTGNYFSVLGVHPLRGRFFGPKEDIKAGASPLVVMSHGLWRRRFGADPTIVGRTVKLNGLGFTVIGVAPEGFRGVNSLFSPDLWAPLTMYAQLLPPQLRSWYDERRALLLFAAGRLKPGVTLAQAEANLKTIAKALEAEYPKPNLGRGVTLRPLVEATIFPGIRQIFVLGGAILMTVVGLVLLIACSNVANLLMARASARKQEIAVRLALGARRGRLVRQLLTESVLMALIGGILGLGVAAIGRDLIWSMRPPFLAQNLVDLTLDPRVLGFTAGVSLLTGILFGLIPAFQASRADVVSALKEESRSAGPSRRRLSFSNGLVVFQVALSLVALAAAGLFLRSLQSANQISPGFDVEKLAVVNVNPGQAGYSNARSEEFYRLVTERAMGTRGIESVSWTSLIPLAGGLFRTIMPEGHENEKDGGRVLSVADTIAPGYFQTTGIQLLRGRDFTSADREGTAHVAIVNQTMADRFWPNQNAVGKRFKFYTDDFFHEIVGIARTSKYNTIGEDPQIAVYTPLAQNMTDVMALVVRAGDPPAALGAIQSGIRLIDRNVPLTFPFTMRELVYQSLWPARMAAVLLGILGGLALVLASVGLYGVMAYSVSQRKHEIGVRMALGAGQPTVLRMVLVQALRLVSVGLVLGLIGALAVSRLVVRLLFGVSATDPTTFVGVALVLVIVAAVASYIPAFRASRVDPLKALRY
ncbi:MAG: ABC transporter permease [Acidobacteria bacterium]|nr:ABC transporter permease [Acidobacteriota bacterium]